MKIHLTYDEAVNLIKNSMADKIVGPFSISIGRKKPNPIKTLKPVNTAFFNSLERVDAFVRCNIGTNKISCIRYLRDYFPYGLKEAKDSIENWERFYSVAKIRGCWPIVGYSGDGSPLFN